MSKNPWVVVRRAEQTAENIPVGVRGSERHLRWAASVSADDVIARVSPEQLVADQAWYNLPEERWHIPAIAMLQQVAEFWSRTERIWGPGGSVGFELATGQEVTRPESDLDLILRLPERLSPELATELLEKLTTHLSISGKWSGVRLDVQAETAAGSFSLAEWARGGSKVMLKTCSGPILTNDPWEISK
ncbi:phosphoribosyl-dephospho-CoA transferase [Paenibacillus xylanexedens]|uniref:Phosphoribosyl-dephospho-CoA transferase n=2 Tax=Paenibacillus xylanexedens TaxID=528191 RepID=A0ABS4RL44_PAEXY|nr:phosphoribosyl-dephospho-CoA transferase [Paenibacillus xylanexedens]